MVPTSKLVELVQKDPTLSPTDKHELLTKLNDQEFTDKLMHGVMGAGIAVIVAKYMKLSKPAQVLLAIAGFGVGKYLLDAARKHDKFLQYNEKLNVYDIKA